jgi:hypothetical protein
LLNTIVGVNPDTQAISTVTIKGNKLCIVLKISGDSDKSQHMPKKGLQVQKGDFWDFHGEKRILVDLIDHSNKARLCD